MTGQVKIKYIIGSVLGGGGFGNTGAYSVGGLIRNGFDVRISAMGNETAFIDDNQVDKISGSLEFAKRFSSLPLIWKITNIESVLKDNHFDFMAGSDLGDVDILHAWSNFGLRSLLKAKKRGIKTTLDRASSHIGTQADILSGLARKWGLKTRAINKAEIKKAELEYKFADYIFVPSEFSRQSFVERGFDEKRLVLLPFGVDSQELSAIKAEPEKFVATFVGQIGIEKGVPELIEAWKKADLKDASLRLVGSINQTGKELLKKITLPDNVEITGHLQGFENIFAGTSVFLFPSHQEGSALVTYEAMAAGLPQVTTFQAGSVVRDGEDGFIIQAGDSDSLTEKILYFYNNRERIREMGESSRVRVKKYTWEDYGNRFAEAMKAVSTSR